MSAKGTSLADYADRSFKRPEIKNPRASTSLSDALEIHHGNYAEPNRTEPDLFRMSYVIHPAMSRAEPFPWI